ncbi:MAG: NAD-dependent epimerase/dehydratase family protein [Pseudomonadota bacterium]
MAQTGVVPPTISITGATGFIGIHLVSRLNALNWPIRLLVRPRSNRTVKAANSTAIVEGSLGDRDAVMALLRNTQTCIHAAGATKSITENGFYTANVIGTYDIAACAVKAGVKHFVYVSSQAARAPQLSNYASSKSISEAALRSFESEMKISIIRPPAVIGSGDPMLNPMFDLIKHGWLPAPSAPKTGGRSFAVISVSDLIDELVSTIQAGAEAPRLIEPCSLVSTNWTQVADAASNVVGREVRLLQIAPAMLKSLGLLADGMSHLLRRPMPISLGKVREMLAADWTYDRASQDAMTLEEILRDCLLDQG